ncbi:MAG: tetratricopeptide repeat protein [Crocinitomicaceae bacterium]
MNPGKSLFSSVIGHYYINQFLTNVFTYTLYFFLSSAVYGQISVDSLSYEINHTHHDTSRVLLLIELAKAAEFKGEVSKSEQLLNKAIKLAEDVEFSKGVAAAIFYRGWFAQKKGDYDTAQKDYIQALEIQEKINDEEGKGRTLTTMGILAIRHGEAERALEYYDQALEIKRNHHDTTGIMAVMNNIAVVHLQIGEEEKAIRELEEVYRISKILGDSSTISTVMENLAVLYFDSNQEQKAFDFANESYNISKSQKDYIGMSMTSSLLCEFYMEKGQFDKALTLADSAIYHAKMASANDLLLYNYELYSKIYAEKGDYKKAYHYSEDYKELRDSIFSLEKAAQISELSEKYESEKKAQQISFLEQESHRKDQLSAARQEKQQITIWFVSTGLGLLSVFVFFLYNRFKLTRKQNDLIAEQKKVVEEKHKEITDSIQYAKRIQSAILPPLKLVKQYLPESFILYKPKDVVAGDFYWMEYKNGKILFAAADCTGHGVPGAMVSVVCVNGLNRAVREFELTDPGQILDKTREIVISEFEKSEEEVKDGMDIALCSLRFESNSNSVRVQNPDGVTMNGNAKLQYAGAHNPLWVIRNGEILETKANKQPIGKFDNREPYTTYTFELQKGDIIYIFTDGFQDQFGGEKGKKYKAKNFKKLLLSVKDKPMAQQKKLIDEAFENWKGNLEQLDDVCVVGVRI